MSAIELVLIFLAAVVCVVAPIIISLWVERHNMILAHVRARFQIVRFVIGILLMLASIWLTVATPEADFDDVWPIAFILFASGLGWLAAVLKTARR